MKHFVGAAEVASVISGRRVALVGSGPGVLDNAAGFVDSHDVVVRVNNYKTGAAAGSRTDVFASYFGNAIRKTAAELQADGVRLCLCKCPDAKAIESEWHERNRKQHGVDFRWIYRLRADFWFCPTYVPSLDEFLQSFRMLGEHVPTSGFAALLQVLAHAPASVYLTGFDFFTSGVHNVNESWKPGRSDDPIGHVPEREREWLKTNADRYPLTFDERLKGILQ